MKGTKLIFIKINIIVILAIHLDLHFIVKIKIININHNKMDKNIYQRDFVL